MEELTQIEEFDNIVKDKKETPLIIFKHSTRCPISWNAKKELDSFLENHPEYKNCSYSINVIDSRPLSNYITETLKVEHQSPQIIIIKKSSVLSHFSHFTITEQKLLETLQGIE
ncbi:MAG TPA: bacillithiol system redox-active protein YtxJ [Candidatus Hydrogenedens sp.]|nr:bacillithiol system redox-active protein YtxJ [Candidatus Hydrogenedens sp.]